MECFRILKKYTSWKMKFSDPGQDLDLDPDAVQDFNQGVESLDFDGFFGFLQIF
jgi:hypothetical protein